MLDFNEVFWPAEKRGKHAKNALKHVENAEKHAENAENCGFWKFFRGRIALRTRIIFPPLSPCDDGEYAAD